MRTDETEVLVVGAGPVGMMAALLLAKAGIRVRIIDQGRRATTHSYACVLHSSALRILAPLGLLDGVREQGLRIDSVGLYDTESRRAELKLSELHGSRAFALTLPQSSFEGLLEQRLAREFNINVEWNHRLRSLASNDERIVAAVDELTQPAKGFIGREWNRTIHQKLEIAAAFIVGADGHDSAVRKQLGIPYDVFGEPELFAIFEFETDTDPGNEGRIVIDDQAASVLWPLPNNRCRWSFNLANDDAREFPGKDRETANAGRGYIDEIMKRYAEDLARTRAAWFQGTMKGICWSTRVSFQAGLARRFGTNRAWLVGDAAHQTGPIGAQSLNAGLREAEDLSAKLTSILRRSSPQGLLAAYEEVHEYDWKKLLGTTSAQISRTRANDWTKKNCVRILNCLPATGEDLALLAGQIGLSI